MSFTCNHCDKSFTRKYSVTRHVQKFHDGQIEEPSGVTRLSFASEIEFDQWKEKMETETRSSFYKRSSKKAAKGGIMIYYRCVRNGFSRKKINPRDEKRKSWMKGSCKAGNQCSAEIKRYDLPTGVINIVFHSIHTGHANEMCYLRLPKSVESAIVQKIKDGVALDRILDDLRNDAVTTLTLEQKHLLSRKKLYNIIQRYNLSSQAKYKDDVASMNVYVKKCESMKMNPIVMYKKIYDIHDALCVDDVMLVIMTEEQREMLQNFGHEKICLDFIGNKDKNVYPLLLMTVYVIDELGACFPVCYCISNTMNEVTMTVLFQEIKKLIGEIRTKAFISDDVSHYYNAWVKVMHKAEGYFLHRWLVDRAWKRKLTRLAKTIPKSELYGDLKALLEEPNQVQFATLLENFLTKLENPKYKDFKRYFETTYAKRPQVWAACYRDDPISNTDAALEASHRNLLHKYARLSKRNRLNCLVQILLKTVRDKTFDRLIRLQDGYADNYTYQVFKRHQQSSDVIDVVQYNENEWKVDEKQIARQTVIIQHTIRKNTTDCYSCPQKCIQCDICVHTYTCTCDDYYIFHNLCKHIHAVAILFVDLSIEDRSSPFVDASPLTEPVEIIEKFIPDFTPTEGEEQISSTDTNAPQHREESEDVECDWMIYELEET